jgi:hypothetical protein
MRPPVPPAVVIGTFAWRLLLSFCAFYGWWLYGHDPDELIFLTQSGNLLTAIVFLGVACYGLVVGLAFRREAATHVWRGAMALLLLVVASTYVGVIGGDTAEAKDAFTHVITPLLVLADWCFVGRRQNDTRWWQPLTWLVVPSVWLVWYSTSDGFSDRSTWGSPIYDFMDPQDGSYPGVLTGLVLGTIAGAYLLYGVAKVKRAISRTTQPAPTPWGSPPYPPPQYPPPQYPPPQYQQRQYAPQGHPPPPYHPSPHQPPYQQQHQQRGPAPR